MRPRHAGGFRLLRHERARPPPLHLLRRLGPFFLFCPLDRLSNVAHDGDMSNTATLTTAEVMAAHINAAPHLTPMVGRDELWPPERVVGIARAERAS